MRVDQDATEEVPLGMAALSAWTSVWLLAEDRGVLHIAALGLEECVQMHVGQLGQW